MLCVTGNETTPLELAKRVTHFARPNELAAIPLQEVRLDFVRDWDDSLLSLIANHREHLLVTCRSQTQGGEFRGSDSERWELLERVVRAGAQCIDLEDDTPDTVLANFRAARKELRIVISFHDFFGYPSNIEQHLQQMTARDVDVIKLAVAPCGLADLESLLTLRKMAHWKPTLLIGMGEFGTLSRLRYRNFGSPWTYVSADERASTAPGQLTVSQALQMGLPDAAQAPFLALLGGKNVAHSPGPRVYNTSFRNSGLPYTYAAINCDDIEVGLRLLEACDAKGASITMPHKERVMPLLQPDALASRVGACNSVRFEPHGGRPGTNTDVAGIRIPLEKHGATRGSRALILGTGGAARAALLACEQLGLNTSVASRDPERAKACLPPGTHVVSWETRASVLAEILLNATPLFGEFDELWPPDAPLRHSLVFDFALGDGESNLISRARKQGITTISPHEMWHAQAQAQMEFILGRTII